MSIDADGVRDWCVARIPAAVFVRTVLLFTCHSRNFPFQQQFVNTLRELRQVSALHLQRSLSLILLLPRPLLSLCLSVSLSLLTPLSLPLFLCLSFVRACSLACSLHPA